MATAASEAIWERPPESRMMAVLGGLESTAKEPTSPARTLPAPTPAKSRLTSSGLSSSDGNVLATAAVCMMQTMATTRASGTSWVSSPMSGRAGTARRGGGTASAPTTLTPRASRWNRATAKPAPTRPISAPGTRWLICAVTIVTIRTPSTERERIRIGLSDTAEGMDEAHQHVPLCLGHAQQGRQLADDDVDGDAGEEAGGDGNREQGGEPAGPQQADGEEDDPDQDRQQRSQIGVMGGADGGDGGQPAGEDRRDGGVRRHRHEAVGAERGEGERAGGKGIEPGLRRHAREPRGRELPGDRDRRQHEPGDQVARQPFDPIALQR